MLNKYANDTKLSGIANTTVKEKFQTELDGLIKWVKSNKMKFNKNKH